MLIPLAFVAASGLVPLLSLKSRGIMSGYPNYATTIQKLTFLNETVSTLSATMSGTRGATGSFGDSGVAVYNVGGIVANTTFGSGDKISVPGETRSSLSTPSPARYSLGGFANDSVAGYAAGGDQAFYYSFTSAVDKYAFPSDTRSNLGTGLSRKRFYGTGFENKAVAGYIAGGDDFAVLSDINKFSFPSDTRSVLASGLSFGRFGSAGLSNDNVAGYVAGGEAYPSTASVDKISYISETRTTLVTGLTKTRAFTYGLSNAGSAGYVPGGNDNTIDKLNFTTDSISTISATLSSSTGINGAAA